MRGVARDILPPAPNRAGAAGMASGQAADYGQQALAAEKLLSEKDLCFRVGGRLEGKSGFWELLADMPGRYWKYGTYRLAVMGLAKDPLN